MRVEIEPRPDGETLRMLVTETAEQLLGPCQVIDAEMPVVGGPLLVLDHSNRLIVIGFDAVSAERAVESASLALEEITGLAKWLRRLYPNLPAEASIDEVQVVLLVPASARTIKLLMDQPTITVQPFRVLRIDGIPALFFEPPPVSASTGVKDVAPRRMLAPGLTADEAAFFQRL